MHLPHKWHLTRLSDVTQQHKDLEKMNATTVSLPISSSAFATPATQATPTFVKASSIGLSEGGGGQGAGRENGEPVSVGGGERDGEAKKRRGNDLAPQSQEKPSKKTKASAKRVAGGGGAGGGQSLMTRFFAAPTQNSSGGMATAVAVSGGGGGRVS